MDTHEFAFGKQCRKSGKRLVYYILRGGRMYTYIIFHAFDIKYFGITERILFLSARIKGMVIFAYHTGQSLLHGVMTRR